MRGDEGDLDRAVEVGDDALRRWRPGARGYEHADHLHLQADAKYWTGDYAGAVEGAMRTREVAGDVHSAHALLRGGGIEAMTRMGLGEHEAALAQLDAMIEIAHELGEAGAYLANYKSAVFREVFDLDAARTASETALEASKGLAFGMPRRFALSDLLQTALLAGDIGRAQADWPALWEDASEATGWTRWLIIGRLAVARAEIATHLEPPDVAADRAAKAVDITVRTRRRKYESLARAELGRALVALGRASDGVAELRAAVSLADALTNPAGRWRVRAALADGLRAVGRRAGCRSCNRRGARARHDIRIDARARTGGVAPRRTARPGAVRHRRLNRFSRAIGAPPRSSPPHARRRTAAGTSAGNSA